MLDIHAFFLLIGELKFVSLTNYQSYVFIVFFVISDRT